MDCSVCVPRFQPAEVATGEALKKDFARVNCDNSEIVPQPWYNKRLSDDSFLYFTFVGLGLHLELGLPKADIMLREYGPHLHTSESPRAIWCLPSACGTSEEAIPLS